MECSSISVCISECVFARSLKDASAWLYQINFSSSLSVALASLELTEIRLFLECCRVRKACAPHPANFSLKKKKKSHKPMARVVGGNRELQFIQTAFTLRMSHSFQSHYLDIGLLPRTQFAFSLACSVT